MCYNVYVGGYINNKEYQTIITINYKGEKQMSIEEIQEKRESLFQELKDNFEATKAEDFKYWETFVELRGIIDDLEVLRNKELDFLGKKF